MNDSNGSARRWFGVGLAVAVLCALSAGLLASRRAEAMPIPGIAVLAALPMPMTGMGPSGSRFIAVTDAGIQRVQVECAIDTPLNAGPTCTSTGTNATIILATTTARCLTWQCDTAANASPNRLTCASLDGGTIASCRKWTAGQNAWPTRIDAPADGGVPFSCLSVSGTSNCVLSISN